jgi:hypothetical protein
VCALAFLPIACGSPSQESQPLAGLMIRVSTNAPQRVGEVAIEIYTESGAHRVFRNVAQVGTVNGQVTLPASLAVEPGSVPRPDITVYAYLGDSSGNILGRSVAETTVPSDRFAELDMFIDVTCIAGAFDTGTIGQADGNTVDNSKCPAGQTCKAGQCESDQVSADGLVDYSADGGGSTALACFDTAACFASSATAVPVDKTTCTFPGADTPSTNVALIANGNGVPAPPFGDLAVLDRDSTTGWTPAAGGMLQLAPGICQQINRGVLPATVVVSTSCATKAAAASVCSKPKGGTGSDAGADVQSDTPSGDVIVQGETGADTNTSDRLTVDEDTGSTADTFSPDTRDTSQPDTSDTSPPEDTNQPDTADTSMPDTNVLDTNLPDTNMPDVPGDSCMPCTNPPVCHDIGGFNCGSGCFYPPSGGGTACFTGSGPGFCNGSGMCIPVPDSGAPDAFDGSPPDVFIPPG